MPASVVPCQLPINEMMRGFPVARRIIRWATSLASEPASPNQTFFLEVAGRQMRSAARPARLPGSCIPETRMPQVARSSCSRDRCLDTLVAVAETGRRPGRAKIDVAPGRRRRTAALPHRGKARTGCSESSARRRSAPCHAPRYLCRTCRPCMCPRITMAASPAPEAQPVLVRTPLGSGRVATLLDQTSATPVPP